MPKRNTRRPSAAPQRKPWLPLAAGLLVLLLVAVAVVLTSEDNEAGTAGTGTGTQGSLSIPHLHGMGFTADGSQLMVAAHDGFRVFADGRWSQPDLPINDYMGYTPVDDGFYSSGHPGPGSPHVNPLGLVKSSDGGRTLTTLAFEGESDFHIMGAGYRSHAVYVYTPQANSRLAPGLHVTTDDGASWAQVAMQGVPAPPISIAVHPTDQQIVALGTEAGLFLSQDGGQTFARVGEMPLVSAAAFSPQGDQLIFGGTSLAAYDLQRQTVTPLAVPALGPRDAIAAIAINPAQPAEIVFGTFNRDIYRSTDGGQQWQPIARNGGAV